MPTQNAPPGDDEKPAGRMAGFVEIAFNEEDTPYTDDSKTSRNKSVSLSIKQKFFWLDSIARDTKIGDGSFRCAFAILQFVNNITGEAWPSIETLAKATATNIRSVSRNIGELEKANYLTRKRGGAGRSNRYRLNISDLPNLADKSADSHAKSGATEEFSGAKSGSNELDRSAKLGSTEVSDLPILVKQTGQIRHTNSSNEPFRLQRETISPPLSMDVKVADEGFELFWAAYPKRVGRGEAEKLYRKILASGATKSGDLIDAVKRYADQRIREEPDEVNRARFTKNPATWLNQQCWQDEAVIEPGQTQRPISHMQRALLRAAKEGVDE